MPSAADVAAYILKSHGPMTAMKLQKLVYYSQAWSLVWDSKPIFTEPIEAWDKGPVVRALYSMHKGQFEVKSLPVGDPSQLTQDNIETIDAVMTSYGDKSAHWLSELTHSERPWIDARKDESSGSYCSNEITHADMAEFYSSIR